MKVLFVTEYFPTGKDLKFSGGVEARTYFVAKHLAKRHEVSVICTKQPYSKKLENLNNVKVYRVGQAIEYHASGYAPSIILELLFIKKAIDLGSKLKPDVVDGGNFVGNFIAKQISNRINIPVVYWYPDVFIGQWLKTSGVLSGTAGFILEKFNLLRSADHFISISNSVQKKLLKQNILAQKISVIPCGIDQDEFRASSNNKRQALICISRLVSYKFIDDLIFAFALIRKKNQNLELTIIGRGPRKKHLASLCSQLKIKDQVTFKQNLSRIDLIEEIKSSLLFCLPSSVEGFGISIIEAAAAGVPYVVSDIDVFKEVTKNGQGGFLFKLRDINDLAAKIERLITDKKLYEKKSKEAIKLSQNYQWSEIAKRTEKIYLSLIQNRHLNR